MQVERRAHTRAILVSTAVYTRRFLRLRSLPEPASPRLCTRVTCVPPLITTRRHLRFFDRADCFFQVATCRGTTPRVISITARTMALRFFGRPLLASLPAPSTDRTERSPVSALTIKRFPPEREITAFPLTDRIPIEHSYDARRDHP